MSSKMETSVSSSSAPEAKPPRESSKARCVHFGQCGGCQLQNLDYSEQLAKKRAFVESLLRPIGWEKPVPIHPSPELWYYRNKMEFSFQDVYPPPPAGEDYLYLGLKRIKRWDRVLNLSECHLLSPEAPRLLAAVHAWALSEKLDPYNLHRQKGFLRHLVLREAKGTQDRMALLLTGEGELPKSSFVSAVRSAYPATTILWGINSKKADVAKSDAIEILEGPGTITEEMLGRRFRVSPYSFFQTNTRGAAGLYTLIRQWLGDLKPKNTLDLYCGSGGITLCVADLCEHVIGVECAASSLEDARFNAKANGTQNAEFMEAKVEDLLPVLAARDLEVDTVILDPPRTGLHPGALKALKDLSPYWIIYVSCNPKAMAEDLRRLTELYTLQSAEAMDLFPHTEHVEALALLKSIY